MPDDRVSKSWLPTTLLCQHSYWSNVPDRSIVALLQDLYVVRASLCVGHLISKAEVDAAIQQVFTKGTYFVFRCPPSLLIASDGRQLPVTGHINGGLFDVYSVLGDSRSRPMEPRADGRRATDAVVD